MADTMSDVSCCIFTFFFFFCSSFSSRLHYKIEQKNHSPSNFAWVSKDRVGWHGVGEEETIARACTKKKEKEEGKEGEGFSENIVTTAGRKCA